MSSEPSGLGATSSFAGPRAPVDDGPDTAPERSTADPTTVERADVGPMATAAPNAPVTVDTGPTPDPTASTPTTLAPAHSGTMADPSTSPPTRSTPATGARAERNAPSRGKAPPRRKRKARRVHRVVHHLDVWSVAKVTAVFVACGYVTSMISGFLLWQAAERVGTIDGVEGFIESSAAYESYEILGDVVFRVAAGVGVVLALVVLAMAVLGALLFNLISDLTGGIRMTVIDEDLIVAPARRPPG